MGKKEETMQITQRLFDECFLILGFRDKCLHCAELGNSCDGVHSDPRSNEIKTTVFYCLDYKKIVKPSDKPQKLLAKIYRRYHRQHDLNAKGGRNSAGWRKEGGKWVKKR